MKYIIGIIITALIISFFIGFIPPPEIKIDETIYNEFLGDHEVTIAEFTDFECPYCRQMHPILAELEDEGKIELNLKHFPRTESSMEAAVLFECVSPEIGEHEAAKLLFDIPPDQRTEFFNSFELENCSQYYEKVLNDFNQGLKVEVKGTPTMFVNGHRVEGFHDKDSMLQIIEAIK